MIAVFSDLATTPTGFQVLITGSSGTVRVYGWKQTPQGVLEYQGELSITNIGPGVFQGLVSSGYWFFLADDNAGFVDLSPVQITGGITAALTRIRAAIKAQILTLGLGIPVYEEWTPDDSETDFPCVVLTHESTSQTKTQVIVGTSDIGHPIRVMIMDRVSKYEHDRMPNYDFWRDHIWKKFDNKRLPGVPEVLTCEIEPDQISDPRSVQYQEMVSQFIIRVNTREYTGY